MLRRVGIVAVWFAVTLVAIGIAATAVGSVRGQVTDVPAIPTAGTAALLASSTTTVATTEPSIGSTTTQPPATTTETPSTTGPDTGTTTSTTSSTTTTTTLAETTTTAAPAIGPAVTTHRLIGGHVTISALEPDVTLVAAVPAAGFSAEIDNGGPNEVRVEFESEEHKSSFRAEWDDGELEIEIDEEGEDD